VALEKALNEENPELVVIMGKLIIELHKTLIITEEEAKSY